MCKFIFVTLRAMLHLKDTENIKRSKLLMHRSAFKSRS